MSALIKAARAAMQALYGYPYDDAHWKLSCKPAADNLREALAAAEAQPADDEVFAPLDYLHGHADGLEWAALVVEQDDPRTGDWMYDDRADLAAAIRKGPEMPPAAPVPAQPVGEPVGEVVIGEEGMTKGWTVIRWRADLPPIAVGTKLYTAPPAQPAAQPLTYEQISALVLETVYENDERIPYRDYWVREIGMPFARAIERAHGIGSQP